MAIGQPVQPVNAGIESGWLIQMAIALDHRGVALQGNTEMRAKRFAAILDCEKQFLADVQPRVRAK